MKMLLIIFMLMGSTASAKNLGSGELPNTFLDPIHQIFNSQLNNRPNRDIEPPPVVEPVRFAKLNYKVTKLIFEMTQDGTASFKAEDVCEGVDQAPVYDFRNTENNHVQGRSIQCESVLYGNPTTVYFAANIAIADWSGPDEKSFGAGIYYSEPQSRDPDSAFKFSSDFNYFSTKTLNLRDATFHINPNKNKMLSEPGRIESFVATLELIDDQQ